MERKRGCKRGCLLEANNEAGLLLIQVCKKKKKAQPDFFFPAAHSSISIKQVFPDA
ncbi:MAG: hypothetical protein C0P75_008975 [Bacilli bacterium]